MERFGFTAPRIRDHGHRRDLGGRLQAAMQCIHEKELPKPLPPHPV